MVKRMKLSGLEFRFGVKGLAVIQGSGSRLYCRTMHLRWISSLLMLAVLTVSVQNASYAFQAVGPRRKCFVSSLLPASIRICLLGGWG